MSDILNVTATGHLGGDPEVRRVGTNSTKLATFSLAVDQWLGPNQDNETAWLRVSLWGQSANLAQYLSKGDFITVAGQLRVTTWATNDGQERRSLEITARDIRLPKRRRDSPPSNRPARDGDDDDLEFSLDDDDDLPFQ